MLDKTSSIICAFGLASVAPRSPYRHLELCGIALIQSHIKNICFDAFADKSAAAEKSVELDDKTFGNMIKEEIDRINAEEKAGNVAE